VLAGITATRNPLGVGPDEPVASICARGLREGQREKEGDLRREIRSVDVGIHIDLTRDPEARVASRCSAIGWRRRMTDSPCIQE